MRHTIVPGTVLDSSGTASAGELVGASGAVYTLGAAPIGVGGQAEVWPATARDGTRLAVKIAHAAGTPESGVAREAELLEALAATGYDHAVRCLDRVEHEGRAGFVMPLYPADLDIHVAASVAAARGRGIEVLLGIVAALARALSGLHALDLSGHVVHRDVKPENVLVDAEGRLLLADFGGSLVVDPEAPVEIGIFGSPLWAPFDQMLPGNPEPNPTWDTYAACVCLFWWLTGGRPAYQADPSPMLSERGRAIWTALATLEDPEADRLPALRAMVRARNGTVAADLLDVKGHGAIQPEDQAAIAEAVRRLGSEEVYGSAALAETTRRLADLLARGLSPLAHPSPPNRYWRADELAEGLDGIVGQLAAERAAILVKRTAEQHARVGDAERAGLREQVRVMSRRPRVGWWLAGFGVFSAVALGGLGVMARLAWPEEAPPAPAGPDAVLVPAGPSVHGDAWGDGEPDERPTRPITLGDFRIQRTEVSTADYRRCVEAGVCAPIQLDPEEAPWTSAPDAGERPAVGVTWQQAGTWCAWAGGRLPSEEEWEKAATFDPGGKRRWPWGEAEPSCERANAAACATGGPLPVDALPAGASPAGARQLVGNVWEWTTGTYTVARGGFFRRVTETQRVLRGGSFESTPAALRTTFRRHDRPETVSPLYGFRCVYEGKGE